jgi:hypothetical protein
MRIIKFPAAIFEVFNFRVNDCITAKAAAFVRDDWIIYLGLFQDFVEVAITLQERS